jgi:DNA-directed RNA polymerase specialized sigma24 family protein
VADTEGFEKFYLATVGRLLGQLFPVTGDLHEAEEIVQEAYARASTRWARLRDYDVPEAWVRRVAMNLADLPVEEVAAILGARTGTVKSWLARGRKALAARLADPEGVRSR